MRRGWARVAGWLSVGLLLEGIAGIGSGSSALAQTASQEPLPEAKSATTAPINSQVQVSRRFLLALLRGDYAAAYGQLAPEVRRGVSAARFRQLGLPVVRQGQQRGLAIELYKMGVRLDEAGPGGKPFVAFAWSADAASAQRMPPEWLEVMFRSTEARQVLGFRLRHP